MKRLLKGGAVASGNGVLRADVLIDGEKIAAVGLNLPEEGAQVEDVTEKLLLPGFVDAHTHFDLDVAGTTTADDFASGTRSALRGGTTTVVDFACPNRGDSLRSALDAWHKKAGGKAACDYGFHMTLVEWNEKVKKELLHMYVNGVTSFKMYMTYPALRMEDADLFRALEEIRDLRALVGVHCENGGVIDALIAQGREKSPNGMGPAFHPLSRPAALEAEAIGRLLRIAQVANCPVNIVHLSSEAGMDEVRAARNRGQRVLVETCPQYLFLDDSVYYEDDFNTAAGCVCAPPLREESDRAALIQALAKGEIQTVCTDHCAFPPEQKAAGREDFTKIPGGLPGVETRGVLLYSNLVDNRRLSIGQMVRVLSENPAKLYGMWPRKGVLAAGSDADIVIYDPEAESVITGADQLSKAGYTPYEGFRTVGAIEKVYLRGTPAVERGKVSDEAKGQFVFRGRPLFNEV